jgi:hypothetical protein
VAYGAAGLILERAFAEPGVLEARPGKRSARRRAGA